MGETTVEIRKLKKPLLFALENGSRVTVDREALVDLVLITAHGPVLVRKVEFNVLPGAAEEILIGLPELQRLKLPNLEETLATLALERMEEYNATFSCL